MSESLRCVVQCVAVCSSVLQSFEVCCSVLQSAAVCRSVLLCVMRVDHEDERVSAVCCSVLQ